MIRRVYRAAQAVVGTALAGTGAAVLGGCEFFDYSAQGELQLVAESPHQWTGVAVGRTGRVFVCYPRWGGAYEYAVEEIKGERRIPYPNVEMNRWSPTDNPSERFVCVQSVTFDDAGDLWVLDTGNPEFRGVIPGAPKLVHIDLADNLVVSINPFDSALALPHSYLNDVRVDRRRNFAYITDSGAGGLIALNLLTGVGRRVLDGHPSTLADPNVIPVIDGREWRDVRTGQVPQIHADGIALDHEGRFLYWQALTGDTLYRIPTVLLRDFATPHEQIAASVEVMGRTVVTDGMEIDRNGRIYFTSLENNSIVLRQPTGELYALVDAHPQLDWPDSFAWGLNRWLYFTTAQIHEHAQFRPEGGAPDEPYRLWRVGAPGGR
ncbi:MAG: L-dopachrome tautomerase-related protein [Planctomycetota bacterium]